MCFANRKWIALVTAEARSPPPEKLSTAHCCNCSCLCYLSGFIACAPVCGKHHSVLMWILLGLFEWGFCWIWGAGVGFWWEGSNTGNLPIPQEQVVPTAPSIPVPLPLKLVLAPGFASNWRVFCFFNFMGSLSSVIFECPSANRWTRTF